MATITDLTGYTVNVPSGWYAPYDSYISGEYRINATMSEYNDNSEISYLGIGYNVGSEVYADNIVSVVGGYGSRTFDPSKSLTFTFTGGDDADHPDLIQWLYNNYATFKKTGEEEPDTPEEPTTPTATITYDGATVTLKEGQTITFRFAEKVFKSDIVIRNNVKESLISFTIDGTTYYAEAGMTWGEWVADTSLNTDGYFIDTSNKNWIGIGTGPAWVGNEQGNSMVTQADTIITNGIYITMHSGGSN